MRLSNNYVDKLSLVVEVFNEQNGNYTIKLDAVENENAKNYKLVHNKLNGDLIVFKPAHQHALLHMRKRVQKVAVHGGLFVLQLPGVAFHKSGDVFGNVAEVSV